MQPALQPDGQVCVDMGPPILEPAQVPTSLPATQVSSCSAHVQLASSTPAMGSTPAFSHRDATWGAKHFGCVVGSAYRCKLAHVWAEGADAWLQWPASASNVISRVYTA